MENKILLVAFLIGFVCIWFKLVKREKKEKIDKIAIFGILMSIIGIVIVLISSFFV